MSESLTLQIERVALGGDGVARHQGKVVFVPGTLPGERVVARLVEQRPRFARAELEHVFEQSPSRRQADCIHEVRDGCGGCAWRHVADSCSLRLKTEAALAELRKLSGTDCPPPQLHEGPLDGQRTRVRVHVDQAALGFFARASHRIVAIDRCRAIHPALAETLAVSEAALRATRASTASHGQGSVVFELDGKDRCFGSVAEDQAALARVLFEMVRRGELAGAGCGERRLGLEWVEETVDWAQPPEPTVLGEVSRPLCFLHRAGAFVQSSRSMNRALQQVLGDALRRCGQGRVLDAYAGSGNLSFVAAHCAQQVLAIDAEPAAEEAFMEAARRNGVQASVAFSRADLSRGLARECLEGRDVVILDPPREGARAVVEALRSSGVPKIFYVSCAPATLARDLARLAEAYRCVSLHAFDMFARTPHVELLAELELR